MHLLSELAPLQTTTITYIRIVLVYSRASVFYVFLRIVQSKNNLTFVDNSCIFAQSKWTLFFCRCHASSGKCDCPSGWTGIYCDTPCPVGTYGQDCQEKCTCENGAACDHITGKYLISYCKRLFESFAFFKWNFAELSIVYLSLRVTYGSSVIWNFLLNGPTDPLLILLWQAWNNARSEKLMKCLDDAEILRSLVSIRSYATNITNNDNVHTSMYTILSSFHVSLNLLYMHWS